MTMPDPLLAVITHLNADADVAALAAGRVFGMELPESEVASMPQRCVVVRHAGGGLMGLAYQDYTDFRFDVFAYGATWVDATALWRAIHIAMKNLSRVTRSSVLLHWARQGGGPIGLVDPDSQWRYVVSTWQLLVSEVNAA